MSRLTPHLTPHRMQRRRLLQSAAALSLPALGALAQAQSVAFPSRPIKLLIAFPAGGPTDITMRQLADNASKILGQPVIIENKPGAGGSYSKFAQDTFAKEKVLVEKLGLAKTQ